MRKWVIIISILAGLFVSCQENKRKEDKRASQDSLTLHIIHAGSLTYPVQRIAEAFKAERPGIEILTEAWGSKAGARRIMEVDTPCDLFLSADYMVIEHMLIPDHASWNIKFAANEMAIVYTQKSLYANEINPSNWHEILLRPDVQIGRSDPDQDPCGVRAVFTSKLAGIYYEDETLPDKLLQKDVRNIRPKETDLIALLETGQVDYIFLYRSVAQQHNFPYLVLPPELSLGDPDLEEWYAQVSTQTLGSSPGSTITETGQPMVYGMTIPAKAENIALAESFSAFLLDPDKGGKILEELGQPSVVPAPNPYYARLPESLKVFALPPKE
ncbi:MAG: tungstate ABC transporter substrate-binding protein WtpA [Bacteroides sp.]|jgi:molybdate/tungstate transport system substrate-binding protein|nr:tungstate ABC transporter substrate-binding protein WtpA [Bacteroides sp.]